MDILGCLNEMGIPFTLQDLHKPTPQVVQKSFEVFVDLFMNVTREVVAPAMRAAAEDMYGADADRVFTPDTRDLMGFYVMLRKFLNEVCRKTLRINTKGSLENDCADGANSAASTTLHSKICTSRRANALQRFILTLSISFDFANR
jgi:hypothetical protein